MYTGTQPIWFPMQFETMRDFKKILWYTQEKEKKKEEPNPLQTTNDNAFNNLFAEVIIFNFKILRLFPEASTIHYSLPSTANFHILVPSLLLSLLPAPFSQCLFPVGNLVCFGGKTTVPGKMDPGASDCSLGGSCMCLVCIVRRDPWGRACNDPLCGTL